MSTRSLVVAFSVFGREAGILDDVRGAADLREAAIEEG